MARVGAGSAVKSTVAFTWTQRLGISVPMPKMCMHLVVVVRKGLSRTSIARVDTHPTVIHDGS